jgi:DNA-binding NtrC family response regulator
MRRILVVDDEASIRKALQMGLSSKEVEVDVADDGKTGVELGSRGHYDVVIADLCLPDLDGLEVIQRIRKHSPEVVSIIISGDPRRDNFLEAKRHEITVFLEKPLDLRSVKDAVERGLQERERR